MAENPTAGAAPAQTPPAATSTTGEKYAPSRSSARQAAPGGRRFSTAFTVPASKQPTMRYMPTYRLEPKFPLNKEVCEKIMKSVMDHAFEEFVYTAKHSLSLTAQVSEEIKNRVKSQNYDRYRYICVVSIGEKVMQGYCSLVNFLWDGEKDGYISYVYDTPKFFAVATLYYLYYD